jgi:hypothetical protein
MILRDITLKDAVRNDDQSKNRKQPISLIKQRLLESHSVEPQQKNDPGFNLLPKNFGLNREGKNLY